MRQDSIPLLISPATSAASAIPNFCILGRTKSRTEQAMARKRAVMSRTMLFSVKYLPASQKDARKIRAAVASPAMLEPSPDLMSMRYS